MADKGFDVSDLLEEKAVVLNIPPFLKGKEQLSDFEVMKTRIIANIRILIGNVNFRAKKNKTINNHARIFVAVREQNHIHVLCTSKFL